jgi:signal transduction histidine kinase
MTDISLHFEVDPSVVYQLGESLITDAVQALIELVKNCYDADGSYAKVIIDTQNLNKPDDSFFAEDTNGIIIEDDGFGMTFEDIQNGWLKISSRRKLEQKLEKKTTPKGRTPLGDKGLGRLGVQKLGNNLEIYTKAKNKQAYHIGFSWLDFATAPSIDKVEIKIDKIDFSKNAGTRIVISDLIEPNIWEGKAIKNLENELSKIISPYKEIREFIVYVNIDNKTLHLQEMSEAIRNIALIRYKLIFADNIFKVSGKVKLDYFYPSNKAEEELFHDIVESNNGINFFDFLSHKSLSKSFNLRKSKSNKWFAEFATEINISDIDGIYFIPKEKAEKFTRQSDKSDINNEIANPGNFNGEIDYYNLDNNVFKRQTVFDKLSEYRNYIKELSGIRLYRDGFGIRIDHDWLKLGTQWTSATSYYGLKPDNTLGYISLSAYNNINLEETTDREGFKDTAYYRNFFLLMQNFVAFTNTIQGFLRRSWNEYKNYINEATTNVKESESIENISNIIKNNLLESVQHKKDIRVFQDRLTNNLQESRNLIKEVKLTRKIAPDMQNRLVNMIDDLEYLVQSANEILKNLQNYFDKLENSKSLEDVIDNRVAKLKEQLEQMYETVALGLTAEALSHEIFNITDQLAIRSKKVKKTIENTKNDTLLVFLEYVNSSVIALRKQVSFLSPSLRYVREERHEIILSVFIKEIVEFYEQKLDHNSIKIKMNILNNADLKIKMNKGKLIQVVDNLIINSEYWLKEDIKQKRIPEGKIIIDINVPYLLIYDNGRGINNNIEDIIFEPFITAKAKGRGLGLFIVSQLLDSEGCAIRLMMERNKDNRLFKFQINLNGVIYE